MHDTAAATVPDRIEVARLHAPRDLRVEREAPLEPGDGQALVRVRAVGLCGSDLHWFDEGSIGDAVLARPLVLGHEFAGEIASGPRRGERVAADPAWACGTCEPCREGRSNLCLRMRFAGHDQNDGALRTTMPWPADLLEPVPDSVGDDEAALLEPAAVALHALSLAPVRPGGSAGVYGCGPIGLILVQLLARSGVTTIVATDRLAHRVEAARSMGATQPVLVPPGGHAGNGAPPTVDVAFEVAGTDDALADALAGVRPGSVVVLVGIPAGDRSTFPAGLARRKGLTLQLCRRSRPRDLRDAINLAGAGRLELGPLISHRFPISEAPEAFRVAAAREGLKVVVRP